MINERYFLSLYCQGARAVLPYVEQLEHRIEDAEARVRSRQQAQVERLTKELARAQATLAGKTRLLIEQRQLNHQLTVRLRELEREIERGGAHVERDSHNSSLPPSLDPPWKKVPRTRSLRKKSGKKVGGQPGHRGATLGQSEHPDHLITYAPEACPGCGASLHEAEVISSERRQVFDLPVVRLTVTEHRRETRRCAACGTAARGDFPAGVRAPAQYGSRVLSCAAYLHFYQLLPVARTSEMLGDLFGCALSLATVERAGRLFSGKLVRTEQRIKSAIRESPVVGADETGLRVCGTNGWIHVARTEALTHFAYDSRRGRDAMQEVGILPQFTGTLARALLLSNMGKPLRAKSEAEEAYSLGFEKRDEILMGKARRIQWKFAESVAEEIRFAEESCYHSLRTDNRRLQARAFVCRFRSLLKYPKPNLKEVQQYRDEAYYRLTSEELRQPYWQKALSLPDDAAYG